jgi:1-acyl-sn-glycerol-3-phosphate acyltransferase
MFQKKLSPLYSLLNKNFQIQISGLENISENKNYIFAMNHQSIMDIPIAFSFLVPQTDRKLNLFLSHKFYNFFFPLMLSLDVISINMNKGKSKKIIEFNKKQINKGIEKLKHGNSALIYPEGITHGGKDNQVIRGETGVIRLALRSNTSIIPIGIRGSNHAYPFLINTYNPFIFKTKNPVHIKVGKEINLDENRDIDLEIKSENTRNTLRKLTEELMEQLSLLSGLPRKRIAA